MAQIDIRRILLNLTLALPFALLLADNDPINPSGQWALIYLLLTTSVTILQKQFKILAVTYRKTIGLWAAAMVCFHVSQYLIEGGISKAIAEVFYDYQAIGWLSVFLLFSLVLTSNKAAQKKLGRYWSRLHLSIYVVIGLGIIHGTTATKLGWYTIYPFAIITTLIFLKKSNKARFLLISGVLIATGLVAIPNPTPIATNPISTWDECLIGPPNHCEDKSNSNGTSQPFIDNTIVSVSCINGRHVEYFADGRRQISDRCLSDRTEYELKIFENFKNVAVSSRIYDER